MKISATYFCRRSVFLALACLAVTFFLAGCATTDENEDPGLESNIPWNQPQPWEGAPGIPGLSQ